MYQLTSEIFKNFRLGHKRHHQMDLLYLLSVFIICVNISTCTEANEEDLSAQLSQMSSFLHEIGPARLTQSNVTSDIQSSLHDIMVDSLMMSHNEAELDGSKRLNRQIDPGIAASNGTIAQDKQQNLAQVNSSLISSEINKLNSTTINITSKPTKITTTTMPHPRTSTPTSTSTSTSSSLETDDESNRFYWQNLPYGNSYELTTILPLEILVTPQETLQTSTKPTTIYVNHKTPTRDTNIATSSLPTTSAPIDTMNTAESNPNSREPYDPRESTKWPIEIIRNQGEKLLKHQPVDFENSQVQFNDTAKPPSSKEPNGTSLSTNLISLDHNVAPKTKIEDLLFIVRHSNLARPQLESTVHPSDHNKKLPILTTRLLNDRESLRVPVRSQMANLIPIPAEMMAQESQQGIRVNRLSKKDLTGAKSNGGGLTRFTSSDSTKSVKTIGGPDSGLSLKSRLSLLSPYSVDFDSALLSDNHPQKRLSPMRTNPLSLSIDEDQTRRQILHDKLKHYRESSIQNSLEKAKGNGKVVDSPQNKNLANKFTIAQAIDVKSSLAKQKVKLTSSGDSLLRNTRPEVAHHHEDKISTNNYKHDERMSMGKRDMNKSTVSSKRPINSDKTDNVKSSPAGDRDIVSKLQKDYNQAPGHVPVNNNRPLNGISQFANLPELSLVNGEYFIKSPVINHMSLDGSTSCHQVSDDPFKKSLYYTTDGVDDDGLFDRGSSPFASRAIASQHGVPFRLKSPTGEKFHLSSIDPFDDRIPDESNLDEEYLYSPLDHHHQQQNLGNDIKLDDDLRKHLAIKSIEDPALMTSLIENLSTKNTRLANQLPNNIMTDPLTQHKKLLANHLIDTSSDGTGEVYHSFATNISPFSALSTGLNYYHPQSSALDTVATAAAATSDSLSNLPAALIRPQATAATGMSSSESGGGGVGGSGGINLMMTDLADKWALSRMPDLIPIPLAATVPGYLIRLPDGRLLAAALTNGFSIQGIQKGPLSASYKNFLNSRIKSLIGKSSSSSTPKQSLRNHQTSGSRIRPISLPAPLRFTAANQLAQNHHQQQNNGFKVKGSERLSNWFSRGVLGQLGLIRVLSPKFN